MCRSSTTWEPGTRAEEGARHGMEYVRRAVILRRFSFFFSRHLYPLKYNRRTFSFGHDHSGRHRMQRLGDLSMPNHTRRKTILVVEDDADIGAFIVQALTQEAPHHPLLVADG